MVIFLWPDCSSLPWIFSLSQMESLLIFEILDIPRVPDIFILSALRLFPAAVKRKTARKVRELVEEKTASATVSFSFLDLQNHVINKLGTYLFVKQSKR